MLVHVLDVYVKPGSCIRYAVFLVHHDIVRADGGAWDGMY